MLENDNQRGNMSHLNKATWRSEKETNFYREGNDNLIDIILSYLDKMISEKQIDLFIQIFEIIIK